MICVILRESEESFGGHTLGRRSIVRAPNGDLPDERSFTAFRMTPFLLSDGGRSRRGRMMLGVAIRWVQPIVFGDGQTATGHATACTDVQPRAHLCVSVQPCARTRRPSRRVAVAAAMDVSPGRHAGGRRLCEALAVSVVRSADYQSARPPKPIVKPFDKLKALSDIEGLRAVSVVERADTGMACVCRPFGPTNRLDSLFYVRRWAAVLGAFA